MHLLLCNNYAKDSIFYDLLNCQSFFQVCPVGRKRAVQKCSGAGRVLPVFACVAAEDRQRVLYEKEGLPLGCVWAERVG